ncbi:hypothetical protein A3F37_02490 [Candidatus Saccharibacteria bacterium RIFCSPHIGHO2_12_FULL_41_12]|nr:MAG: hypothetical protein A3F37_02490 [Candidatus Saccharibacteria bacterium RIFCSPHIGHO2_12_FULL_41_12]
MTDTTLANILIVEDDKSLNEAYTMILDTAGYDTTPASDGIEALSLVEDSNYDLILLDLKMPNMDGIKFLKEYKKRYKNRQAKLVVFSNYDLQNEVKQAYELGIDKYFLKSWASPKDLLKIIEEVI